MHEIEMPAGLHLLGALVDVVENKATIKKVIDEVRSVITEANTKIAVVGKIKDIERLHGKADVALKDANTALLDATREAATIKSKATGSARAKQRKADKAMDEAEALEVDIKRREKSCDAREKELQKHMNASAKLQKEASELKASADELIEKANAQLAIFQGAASQIN